MKKIMTLIIALSTFSIFAADKKLAVDTSASTLEWKATKVTGGHNGKVKIKSGSLNFKDSDLVGGEFVIDMTTISCDDIDNPEYNKKLVNHLKNDDFFSVDKFDTAKLVIKSARLGKGGHYDVEADLTIKGITKPVMFKANVENKSGGATATANVKFNRAHYDVKYNSGSFFKDLGDKLIHDDVEMTVKLSAK